MSGAGPYQGPVTGSLVNFFASIVPRRVGDVSPDPVVGAGSFTTDGITLTYIPNSYSQNDDQRCDAAAVRRAEGQRPAELPVGQALCGFTEGMDVIIFDPSGNWDTFTITHVQDSAGHLQHRGQDLNYAYQAGASVTQSRDQHVLSESCHQPVDEVTTGTPRTSRWWITSWASRFEYLGDPNPPTQPKPGAGIANCLYDASRQLHRATRAHGERWVVRRARRREPDRWPVLRRWRQPVRRRSPSRSQGEGDSSDADGDRQPPRERSVPCSSTGEPPWGRPLRSDYQMQFEVSPRNLNLTR